MTSCVGVGISSSPSLQVKAAVSNRLMHNGAYNAHGRGCERLLCAVLTFEDSMFTKHRNFRILYFDPKSWKVYNEIDSHKPKAHSYTQ